MDQARAQGCKGALTAMRDAAVLKTVYAYGLRRNETRMLDLTDLRRTPKRPQYRAVRWSLRSLRQGLQGKLAQLYHRDGNSYLDLGPRPLIIPPKLARLLNRLAESPNTNQARLVAPGSSRWLFPGLVPGQPTGPATFSHNLPEHGIRALPARNAALAALASTPPADLADILGPHINTAAHWAKVTKRDWTDYLTTRAEDLQRRNTAPCE